MNPFEANRNMHYESEHQYGAEFLDQYAGVESAANKLFDKQKYTLQQIKQQQEDLLLQIQIQNIDEATKRVEADFIAEKTEVFEMKEAAKRADADAERIAQKTQAELFAKGVEHDAQIVVPKIPKTEKAKAKRSKAEGSADKSTFLSKAAATPLIPTTKARLASSKDPMTKSDKCKKSNNHSCALLDGCLPEITTYLHGTKLNILSKERVQNDYLRGKAYTVQCFECKHHLLISGESENSIVLCPNCLALFPKDVCERKRSVIPVPPAKPDRNQRIRRKTTWLRNNCLRISQPRSCKEKSHGGSQGLEKQAQVSKNGQAGRRILWPFIKRNKVH